MLTLLCALVSSALAADTIVDYHGPHPVPDSIEHGMCWIEGPHFHSYEPADRVLYVEDDDHLVFVGDPTEYERASPSAVYYGHHPVTWTLAYDEPVHYCYITGPHHHWHAPPPTTVWVDKGGAWWYVGKHPAWYESRVKRHKHIDAHYARAHVIERPTVVVAPPSGWIGVTFGGGRSGVSASFGIGVDVVHAPPVVYHRPVVIVEEHHHHDHHHKHKHGHGHGHGKHKHKGKGRWH